MLKFLRLGLVRGCGLRQAFGLLEDLLTFGGQGLQQQPVPQIHGQGVLALLMEGPRPHGGAKAGGARVVAAQTDERRGFTFFLPIRVGVLIVLKNGVQHRKGLGVAGPDTQDQPGPGLLLDVFQDEGPLGAGSGVKLQHLL